MATVSDITSGSNPQTTTQSLANTSMGKEEFLQLLVAQLEHQDPLNPSDPTDFTAQLAQFSTLEQLFNLNESFSNLSGMNSELERLSSLSLIGKSVVVESEEFVLSEDEVTLGYRLDQTVQDVTVHIKDNQGQIVATLTEGSTAAGDNFLTWDGMGESGQKLPAGKYNMLVSTTLGEENTTAVALVKGTVTGIDLDDSDNILITETGEFKLSSVTGVGSVQ